MSYTTLVSTDLLAEHLDDPNWVVVDCRFDLRDPARGARDYAAGHIPGARYADLDRDLSGPVEPGRTGRHPLPDAAALAEQFSQWGIDAGVQVVAYDDTGGGYAARLWWLLRRLGHEAVALLDGDWRAWVREGRPIETGATTAHTRPARRFVPQIEPGMAADADEIAAGSEAERAQGGMALLDARAADRYRGQNETIDPVAGHIPGARSAPFAENLDAEGRFLPPDTLRARYQALLDGAPPAEVVVYCGSGVSACHNLVAMEIAGLRGARLYPGSWSEWITDPARAIATEEVA